VCVSEGVRESGCWGGREDVREGVSECVSGVTACAVFGYGSYCH
jgi:hypothetical protein